MSTIPAVLDARSNADDDHGHDHSHGHVHGSSSHDGHPERIAPGDAHWDVLLPEHIQRYQFAAARVPVGARVLDAGCGVGYGTAHLAERGASLVVGVDISEEALGVAREKFSRPGVQWIREDCVSLDAAGRLGPFDCIVNFENLEHVSDPERFLDRVAALLAPGGVFFVSTPNRRAMNRLHGTPADAPTANPFHTREFSAEELHDLLIGRFEHVVLAHQTLDPPERFLYEPLLSLMWSNPFARLGRWVQRVARGRRIAERMEDLLPPRSYRIVHDDPGSHLAITTLAECRRPRRPDSRSPA